MFNIFSLHLTSVFVEWYELLKDFLGK